VINLPEINTLCIGDMIECSTFFKRLAKTLDINL
jgi:hypothetical protein